MISRIRHQQVTLVSRRIKLAANNKRIVRITFALEPDAWHGYATERVWAETVGVNRFKLRNSPFYARGVSMNDVVFADPNIDGQLVFRAVSIRGGHSTYRIILKV